MTFDAVNLKFVLIAALAAWVLGFVYYSALSKPMLAAMGKTEADCKNQPKSITPLVLAFVGALMSAYILSALLHYVVPGVANARAGAISAFFVWLGFTLPPMAINNAFSMRSHKLTVIDTGYWLLALLLQGALIGAFTAGEIVLPF